LLFDKGYEPMKKRIFPPNQCARSTQASRSEKSPFMRSLKFALPFLAFGALTYAQNAKLSSELQGVDSGAPVKVIVQYNHVPT